MTLQEIIAKVPELTIEERKQLMHTLVDSIGEQPNESKTRSILDYAGIAEKLYDGTDAQEYVNQLRSEWDNRP